MAPKKCTNSFGNRSNGKTLCASVHILLDQIRLQLCRAGWHRRRQVMNVTCDDTSLERRPCSPQRGSRGIAAPRDFCSHWQRKNSFTDRRRALKSWAHKGCMRGHTSVQGKVAIATCGWPQRRLHLNKLIQTSYSAWAWERLTRQKR